MANNQSTRRLAYSVSELCECAGISRPMFYKLLKLNKGPKHVLRPFGSRKTLIPVDSAEAWIESMRVETSTVVFGSNKRRRAA